MKVHDIKLTEGEILRRFSVMENKFPRREEKNYFPSLDFYLKYFDDKESAIREEANRMIEFAGLGTYRSNVKFEELDGAAGNILLNSNMVAEITIDEDIAKNIDSVMATLAHEICHKVLYKHGIYFDQFLKEENEVYADLATFYLGFGDLTMKGYKVGNNYSGYLSPDTYAMAYVLMTVINQGVDYNIKGLPPHAQSEIEKASKECKIVKTKFAKLNKENYNEIFSQTFFEIKELFGLYDLLTAALPHMREAMTYLSKNVSDAFYNFEIKDLEWHKFNIAYHAFLFVIAEVNDNYVLNLYREKFGTSFLYIYDAISSDNSLKKIENFTRHCPNCGSPINKQLEPREYHLVCPHCKTHFTIDGDIKTILKYIEKLDTERKKQELIKEENVRLKDENKKLNDELSELNDELLELNKELFALRNNESGIKPPNQAKDSSIKEDAGIMSKIKDIFKN